MKKTIRSLMLVLGTAVLFTFCKKEGNSFKNSFTVNGNSYSTNYAINTGYENSNGVVTYSDFFISSIDFTSPNFNGRVNGVGLTFDNAEPTPGTYTFKDDSDPSYNPATNFFDAYALVDVDWQTGGGTEYGNITSGTATVTVSGSRVTINYDLNFNGTRLTGSYSGAVKMVIEEE
ncbi:hypothetical protein [Paraflavitalea sp. CAU 1676]|uniref:hypothetical protein n=1 Tax=Paraflavitalea sp. CAU 1676 TaxID=3032598 RepID=UPI0023DB6706|nr:hypothetical protein [Paraflavitalea sp. CAU 1676]MDF2191433.1 hypothetical protein [Paraflavitalea sp. CAU 1676]